MGFTTPEQEQRSAATARAYSLANAALVAYFREHDQPQPGDPTVQRLLADYDDALEARRHFWHDLANQD